MAQDPRLKATTSFASEATLSKVPSPSPQSQKESPLPPSYSDDDNKPEIISLPSQQQQQQLSRSKQRLIGAKSLFLKLLKKYWFLLGLFVAIILAWAFPTVARKGGYIHAEWSIKWGAVIIIFLISGLSLRTRILTQTFLRIRLHLLVQIINLIIIPFFVFGLVLLLFKMHVPMNSLVLMGVVIAASTPTTVSSNVVMTKNAKGNEATALMNAALGNVLGIFISPALVDTFQEPLIEATPENETAEAGGSVDFVSVLKQLGITVLIPLVIGQLFQIMYTDLAAKIKVKWRLGDVSSVALLTMVWSVFSDAFYAGSFNAVSATDIVAVAIMNFGFYILFSFLCLFLAYLPFPASLKEPSWVKRLRYSREDTVAVMYCGATKTVAMGVPLINVLYESGDPGTVGVLSTPLLLYHVEQLILGNIEVDILKRWVLRGQREEEQEAIPPARDEEDRVVVATTPEGSGITPSPADTLPVKSAHFFDQKSSSTKEKIEHQEATDDEKRRSIEKPSEATLAKTAPNRSVAADVTRNSSIPDDMFNSPLFTSDTASISLDTSRFSSDTLGSRYLSPDLHNNSNNNTRRQSH